MNTHLRPFAVIVASLLFCLLLPAAALAQWDTPNRAFHKDTAFKLDGKHQAVPCALCHLNGVTKGTPTTCVSCHWERRPDDPYGTRLGSQCEQCHRTSSWSAVKWNHATATGMPLNGAHKALGCTNCHKNNVFTGANGTCVTCHRNDYDTTSTPHHAAAGYSTQCADCHRVSDATFTQTRLDHSQMFPLVGLHAIQNCAACHVNGRYQGTPHDCVGCHRPIYDRTTNPNHATAGFSTNCEGCHRPTDPVWKGATSTINHNAFFPLVGLHATADCASCHVNGRYPGTPTDCIGCHRPDYDRTTSPNHAAAAYSTACEGCHHASDGAWRGVAVNHNAFYPLVGLHATAACLTCHPNNRYQGTSKDCIGCHRTDYDRTTSPNHAAAGYALNCSTCHRAADATWKGASVNHSSFFPLVGLHATASCTACHGNGHYQGTPRDCIGCHRTEYDQTTTPNHAGAAYSTACEGCHSATAATWKGASVNHAAFFPLVGLHATAACIRCHPNNRYQGTTHECVGCHRTDYDRTTNPNHGTAGYPTACDTCHRATDATWVGTPVNHSQYFALVGLHATATCTACHVNNVYKGTARDCVGCHRTLYDRTTTPNHAAAAYSTACDACHSATRADWLGATVNHNSYFALVGLHATAACAACHVNNVYKGTSRDCVGCHRTLYDRTTTPNHAAAGYSTACDTCHSATRADWLGATTVNHNQYFALVGLHATAACTACHVNNVYKGTSRDCVGCHRTLYDRTTKPNHAAAGYSTACDTCHKATDPAWTGAAVNHNTYFALVGVHATAACTTCHVNNVYKGTPRDCVGCHRTLYDRTTTPNHAAAGYSTACDTCHAATRADWLGATVNHTQYFALVGLHATAACTACHVNNVYKGTPRDCYSCHRTDYSGAKNPVHTGASFPTTCDTCHKATDSAWTQGVFSHTWFPITSGKHVNITCAQCHTNATSYTIYTCVTCHAKTQMDSKHQGRSGYRYDSAACYSCHPTGRAG